MSNEATLHSQEVIHGAAHAHDHGHGHDDHEHHEGGFISKYVFSLDHKTIAKQFLITGIIWAIIGAFFSVLFRLQLGFPDATFQIGRAHV